MVQGIADREKTYVTVCLVEDTTGTRTPTAIIMPDGIEYTIEEVIERRHLRDIRFGSVNERYTVVIGDKQRFLWHDNRAFYVQKIVTETAENTTMPRR